MDNAVITIPTGEPFYCPFCGTQTIPPYDESGENNINECEHLIYVGTNEGGFEYVSNLLGDKIDHSMEESDLIDLNLNNAVHFSLCAPGPSSFGVYIGYMKGL